MDNDGEVELLGLGEQRQGGGECVLTVGADGWGSS
jgi:hypothetical protein